MKEWPRAEDKTGAARIGGAPGSGCKDWAHAVRGARMLGSDFSHGNIPTKLPELVRNVVQHCDKCQTPKPRCGRHPETRH